MRSLPQRQSGFTLVEIAIVLVIIGLLLGGVLKGQELIDNSRVKSAANDMNGITTAYNGYFDRFRRIPGDDGPLATLNGRGGNWASVNAAGAGNNNGALVMAVANTFNPAGEGIAFWQQLRAAGFLTGSIINAAAIDNLPRNPFGGLTGVAIGVAATTMPLAVANTGLVGPIVCMSQVPGKAARALDAAVDDGASNTGALRATTGAIGVNTAPGATAAAYNDAAVYTLCRQIL